MTPTIGHEYETPVTLSPDYQSPDALHVPQSHGGILRSATPYASLSPVMSPPGGYAQVIQTTHGITDEIDSLDSLRALDETSLGFNPPPPSLPGTFDTPIQRTNPYDLEEDLHGYGFDSELVEGSTMESHMTSEETSNANVLGESIRTPGSSMHRVHGDHEEGEYEAGAFEI